MRQVLASVLLFGFVPAAAHSAVTPLRWFRLGEADNAPTAGSVCTASRDSIGNGDLTILGSPVYSADAANENDSLSLAFDGSTQAASAANLPVLTTNFGVEAWVKPAAAPGGEHFIVYSGTSGSNGWGIFQNPATGKFAAIFGGRTIFGDGTVTPGVWTHLALVVTDSGATFYVNGTPSGASVTTLPAANDPALRIAAAPATPAQGFFQGTIDEVRVFTFDSGAFAIGDLLYTPPLALKISAASPGVTLTWPQSHRLYGLQTLTDLVSGTWNPVYHPAKVGTDFSVTQPASGPQAFYRLHQASNVQQPPMLPVGSFLKVTSHGATKNVTAPNAAAANAILGDQAATIDASAFVDPADVNAGLADMDFQWTIVYPQPSDVDNPYSNAGTTGYKKPVLSFLANSLLNQPRAASRDPGVMFVLEVTSHKTGLVAQTYVTAQVSSSALTISVFNACQGSITACPTCYCTIGAALPATEDISRPAAATSSVPAGKPGKSAVRRHRRTSSARAPASR